MAAARPRAPPARPPDRVVAEHRPAGVRVATSTGSEPATHLAAAARVHVIAGPRAQRSTVGAKPRGATSGSRTDAPHAPADLALAARPPSTRRPSPRAIASVSADHAGRPRRAAPHARAGRRPEAAVIAGAPLDEALVIDARRGSRARAARERLERRRGSSRSRPARRRAQRASDGAAVERGRRRDVLGALEAALDLERATRRARTSRGTSAVASRSSGESRYARSPRSRTHAVDDELVRQPARLGARAAVRAAAADRLARQALARVRDAERAVDEHLELDVGVLGADRRDVVERQLAREDHAAARPRLARELDRAASVHVICVEAWSGSVGRDRADQPRDARGPAR